VGIELSEIEKKIERKISDLEREKGKLKDDLRVVRQATAIAGEFEGRPREHKMRSEEQYQEPQENYG